MKNMIIRSALTPLRESVTALPALAYGQEGLPIGRQAGHPADLPVTQLFMALEPGSRIKLS